uniref:Uncharacterized protein n=1 Tax=Mola mola TaxID=94237 RepID=A0A3Q3XBA9_MOLML
MNLSHPHPLIVSPRNRQNLFPPLLLLQRPSRLRNHTYCPYSPRTFLPKPSRRPRQFHPRQPPGHPTSH